MIVVLKVLLAIFAFGHAVISGIMSGVMAQAENNKVKGTCAEMVLWSVLNCALFIIMACIIK